MKHEEHKKYLYRCLQIAKNGIGTARPNPSVGAVIVVDNRIVGEGYTSPYGGNHAEVNAIRSVANMSLLRKATMYVTLEPCSHFGQTPPCVDLLIQKQLKRVVIGCIDPNPLVAGKGIARLQEAGCEVISGILENECSEHHRRFFTTQHKKRPYVILKWAESKDRFMAPKTKSDRKPVWISNSYSQQLVHKWRSEEHAILVGSNTAMVDNPRLNVRSWYGNNPIRVLLDRSLQVPKNAAIFDGSAKTIVLTAKGNLLSRQQEQVVFRRVDFSKNIAVQIGAILQRENIQSLLVEGGAQTLQTFIDANIWEEARVFTGAKLLGEGVKAPVFFKQAQAQKNIDGDLLTVYRND